MDSDSVICDHAHKCQHKGYCSGKTPHRFMGEEDTPFVCGGAGGELVRAIRLWRRNPDSMEVYHGQS